MKRRIIQIADSTQLISLPRKWCKKFEIKKGDEMEVTEEGNRIIVSTENETGLSSIEVDVTDLDRSSIIYVIRSIYRQGYDEIKINFKAPTSFHYRLNEKINVISVIHEEVNRWIGAEIVQEKEKFCLIKDLSQISSKEFDNVLRRIFLLVIDASKDMLDALKNHNYKLIETIEDKHATITKFVSYCIRLLNKKDYPDQKKKLALYEIIISLEKITDILKYCARDILEYKPSLRKESLEIVEEIDSLVDMYYNLFYKFELDKISEFIEKRDKINKTIKKASKKIPEEEILLVNDMEHIIEVLVGMIERRVAFEY